LGKLKFPNPLTGIKPHVVVQHERFQLHGATLSRIAAGEVFTMADEVRINAIPVTEDEFTEAFGKPEDRLPLVFHNITDGNIRDIIFGW